jgi:hypothetical protein
MSHGSIDTTARADNCPFPCFFATGCPLPSAGWGNYHKFAKNNNKLDKMELKSIENPDIINLSFKLTLRVKIP